MADETTLRTCIGSAKFGIEAHEAAIEDFPVQPSQRDGLGRMCRPHWTAYTRALRTASGGARKDGPATTKPEPIRTRPSRTRKVEPEAPVESGADAG